ncbi:MAG TPA: flagellar hook-basal body complex protein FliE [Terriglobales bacterium]|nr:flagellar hook-basal body complex protein FliE [Terriglobales bacterium]
MPNPISNPSPAPVAPEAVSTSSGGRAWGFVETLRGAMDQVSQLQQTADAKVGALLAGNGMDVHSALIAVEKADLSFQLMMQVRNKIVSAYQEISRMQF